MVQFWNGFLLGATQKTPAFGAQKIKKWIFLCKDNEKSPNNNITFYLNTHAVCTIWAQFDKQCHALGHDLAHLTLKL
jgi:hypothetical protein